jgi:N-acetylneuraminic acid mutarotase
MIPRPPLALALALSALSLVSCDENPAQPDAPGTSSTLFASAESFPPGTWTIRALMPQRLWRYDLAAGVVDDASGQSTVYVLGGRFNEAPTDPAATTILTYNATNDQWSTKAASFTGAGTNGIGRIGDRLYISGGATLSGGSWTAVSSRLSAYDWRRDVIIRKADMPRRTAYGVTGVINGKLYVLAGHCGQQQFCREFYRYDPATDSWATLPPAPSSHVHGAGAVLGGKFYVAGGGASPYRSFDVYDPATNSWTSPGLLAPRRQFAEGAVAEGKFYVIGIEGAERTGDRNADRNVVAYVPSINSWRNKSSYPGPTGEGGQFLLRPQATVRVLLNGRAHILAIGSGHLYTDDTVKPAGTIDPGPPYIYAP